MSGGTAISADHFTHAGLHACCMHARFFKVRSSSSSERMASNIIRSVVSVLSASASNRGSNAAIHGWKNGSLCSRWLSMASPNCAKRSMSSDQTSTKSREEENYQARRELALAYRALDFYQLGEGICNHLTMRTPGINTKNDVMLIVPYGLHWSQVTASSLIGVDLHTGEKVEGGEGFPLETGVNIHCPIHVAAHEKHGTTVVMHTHQPYTLALVCLDEEEPFDVTMCQTSMRFAGKIAYDWDYQVVASEMDEGKRLADTLGDKEILLMGQHGVLSAGKRVCDVMDSLYYLERAAMVQVLARSMGGKTRRADPAVIMGVAGHFSIPRNAEMHMEALHKLFVDKKPFYIE